MIDIEALRWPPAPAILSQLHALHAHTLGGDPESVYADAADYPDATAWLAFRDRELVGFKMGRRRSSGIFESHMGAVHPDHRRQGIGRALLRRQLQDLDERGYLQLHTQTKNVFRPMLLLDLSEGFEVFGCVFPREELLLMLRKRLGEPARELPRVKTQPHRDVTFELTPLPLSASRRADLMRVHAACFGGDGAAVFTRLEGRPSATCWIALRDDRVVGFKFGSDRRQGAYHSNRGGVEPGHRGQGIARELIRLQHGWAKARGYTQVTTNSDASNRAMVRLNLTSGYDIVGVETGDVGAKIRFSKPLSRVV